MALFKILKGNEGSLPTKKTAGYMYITQDQGNIFVDVSDTTRIQLNANNAKTANKLASGKTISLAGDLSGSATFDGSQNISITATVKDDSHNHTIENVDGLQSALNGKASTAVATQSANGLMSAADKKRLDYTNIAVGTCETAAATAAKVINVVGNTGWALQPGALVVVKFTYTNTAQNPTFNVNGTGAKSIFYNASVITTGNLSRAGYNGRYGEYIYDGTNYVFIGWSYDADSTYNNAILGQGYAACATEEATAAKVATITSYSLQVGGLVAIKFQYAVPASSTLNINSKGAKPIYYRGAAITAGRIKANDTATFIYDGSHYNLVAVDRDDDTKYSLGTFGITATAAELNKLDGATVTTTELNYVHGVTSAIQTQLNNKRANTAPTSGNWFRGTPLVDSNGVTEAGMAIDLHHTNATTKDFSTRLVTGGDGGNTVTLPTASGTLALTSSNVASATKLANTRKINGTDFNGTADITTANWGTARNISIADASASHVGGATSVNGSGNVTLKLPETIKGTLEGSASGLHSVGTVAPQTGRNQIYNDVYSYRTTTGDSSVGAPTTFTSVIGFGQRALGTVEIAGGWTSGMNLWYRSLRDCDDDWYPWRRVLDSTNYVDYTVQKNGTGASGTWGISISGTAAKATQLATGRTINGTAFNGTANITTANWGTARNFTIGNSTKSVNGSAAMSWSLAEIGRGAANGLASLDSNGKVPSSELPSYVDDVIEGYLSGGKFYKESGHTTQITGETGKIYVDLTTSKTYRWSGSVFAEISASLALGTTSSTAFAGDKGQVAYQHATAKGAAFASGLYKITTNAQGHVTAASAVAKADITGLGIPGADTHWTTGLNVGASGATSNSATANPYVTIKDNSTYRSQFRLVGSGATSVSSDANGNITISSSNTDTKVGISAGNPSTSTSYSIPFTSVASGTTGLLVNNGMSYHTFEGTTSSIGSAELVLGNSIASGTAGNKHGKIYLHGDSSGWTEIKPGNNTTSNITLTLPSAGGLLARTADNVASATKLQTARAINGTNFDGTAAITTANWGTARNISISDHNATHTGTAVSVNGSAAVTLKLPATITATLAGNASTASTLATARTINGTSFNGSANITTANWGTSRTLTIGNSGKAVNGSGNVTWSLAEIGALPTAGGTMTGHIYFTSLTPAENQTYPMTSCGLQWTGGTDSASIYYKLADVNVGHLVINVSDDTDSSQQIDFTHKNVNQISLDPYNRTFYPTTNNTGSIGRSGNKWANVYATTLHGTLDGNASTATKLATARTISLTGDVGGSTIFDGSGNVSITATVADDSHNHIVANVDGLQAALNSKQATITGAATTITSSNLTANRALLSDGNGKVAVSSITSTELGYLDGVTSNIQTQLNNKLQPGSYIPTHPEAEGTIIPFSNNDISFLTKRGGQAIISYDGVVQNGMDLSRMFDGTNQYWAMNPTGITTITIELTLHRPFSYGNKVYIDFGNSGWRAKNIKIECMNSNMANDIWSTKANITGHSSGHYLITTSHAPVGATDGAGTGFNKIRFTFSDFATPTIFRIACLGIINYSSLGEAGTFITRDGSTSLFGGLIPSSNNTFDFGTSSSRWRTIYANNFSGNAASATKLATGRTINGTSFNGEANITTANWGTARNITIGSTTKSVNGSGNVSWSLAEIGAAAANHSHSYLPLSGGNMTGAINSNVVSETYLQANQGKAIINSTAAAGAYAMLYKGNSTNGYFTMGAYKENYWLHYTAKATVDAGTNNFTKRVNLLNESGNSEFPGTVTASSFSGSGASLTNLNASNVSSGTLNSARLPTVPVSKGGTGLTTLTSGQVLIGNGTGNVTFRAIDTTVGGTASSTSLITSGAVKAGLTWNNIASKPGTFPPSAHTHAISEVTGLQDALDAKTDEKVKYYLYEAPSDGSIFSKPIMLHTSGAGVANTLRYNNGLYYSSSYIAEGKTGIGVARLELGNRKLQDQEGNKRGSILLCGTSSGSTEIIPTNNTANNNITLQLPATSGTLLIKAFATGTTAPTDTNLLWIDGTATTGGLKYYNGTAWVHVPVAWS